MDAYERLLGDAMAGDATLFARQDVVEAAWAIVDPALAGAGPLHIYEPGSWGPPESDALAQPLTILVPDLEIGELVVRRSFFQAPQRSMEQPGCRSGTIRLR
jgi:hypothetical protein